MLTFLPERVDCTQKVLVYLLWKRVYVLIITFAMSLKFNLLSKLEDSYKEHLSPNSVRMGKKGSLNDFRVVN